MNKKPTHLEIANETKALVLKALALGGVKVPHQLVICIAVEDEGGETSACFPVPVLCDNPLHMITTLAECISTIAAATEAQDQAMNAAPPAGTQQH